MAQQEEKQNLALREFGALNTQAARQVISDQEFSWLSEWMPIGHGNMKLVPGPSAAVASIVVGGQSIYYMMSASINASNYLYCFLTDGSAYEVNTDTGVTTKFANAGTFTNGGVRACQWKNERILIVDPQHGYFSYDRQTLISYQNSVYSVTINAAGGGFTTAPIVLPNYGNATFLTTIGAANVTAIVAGGTGYQVGDILSVPLGAGVYSSGSSSPSNVATIRVTAVGASNAITGAVIETPGSYSTAPTSPVTPTGGYGTSAQFNLGFSLQTVTVTSRGSGYTTIPTLLINPSTTAGSAIPVTTQGNYTIAPANPVSTTGGTGAGLTVNATFGMISAPNLWQSSSNAGYQIGDVLTLSGGTFSAAVTIQITNIVLPTPFTTLTYYYYTILTPGNYSVWPANGTFTTTGGHGSGLIVGQYTVNGVAAGSPSIMGLVSATVANAGAGYSDNNILTLAGGTFSTASQVTVKTGGSSGGAILTANLNLSISGTAIASYSGRVWIATGSRTVVFSAPSSYDDFLTADGAGSFIMTDEQMKSQITALKAANDYLYITGLTSMFILSGVSLQTSQAGSPVTTFNLNNLTTNFGTDLPDGMLPHYRSMIYGSDYGWYMLTGVTPQKISDQLDGLLNSVDLSRGLTAGQCILFGQLCECWLVQYTDPVTSITSATLLVFFNGKWFTSVQNSSLKLISGSVYADTPTLFGTDGVNVYRLFADSITQRTFEIQTKQWDMGNPLITKQITRLGIEVTAQNASSFNISTDTEVGSTSNQFSLSQGGYYFKRINASAVGNYVGMTITGTATPGDSIIGLYMAYKGQTPWADAKGG